MRRTADDIDVTRNVLVAVDLSDQSLKATQWTAYEFCRPGDIVHLVHVARVLSPQTTIQHSYAGASYTVPDPNPIDEKQHVQSVNDIIKTRFVKELDHCKIPHALHMFLDTDNAPASAVFSSLMKVADQVNAVVIVMACHNKAYGLDTLLLGSVADYVTRNCKLPVMIIRDYKLPLIISASSGHATSAPNSNGPSEQPSPR